jgi:hypothetical protein
LLPLQRIQVQMKRGLRIALPFILLSLNDLHRLILLQGLVVNPIYLNVDFPALCRVDIAIPKLMEVVRLFLMLLNRGINQGSQKESDVEVSIGRNGVIKRRRLGTSMTQMQVLHRRMT